MGETHEGLCGSHSDAQPRVLYLRRWTYQPYPRHTAQPKSLRVAGLLRVIPEDAVEVAAAEVLLGGRPYYIGKDVSGEPDSRYRVTARWVLHYNWCPARGNHNQSVHCTCGAFAINKYIMQTHRRTHEKT